MLPYQWDWVADKSRYRIAVKARQIRWTTTVAFEAVYSAAYLNSDFLFISAAEKNAIEALDRCKKWVTVAQDVGCEFNVTTDSRTEIGINGRKILSLAQNPNTVRGFSGNVCLDEYALHAQGNEIYSAAFPITTHGYSLSIVSTPLGQSGKFYDIWSKPGVYRDFSRHSTTIIEAIGQGLVVDVDAIRRNVDDETFRREYLCEFIDESTAYYPYELILRNLGGFAAGGTVYAGIDIGRKRDRTVIYLLQQLGDTFTTVAMEVLSNMTFADQHSVISQMMKEHKVQRACVDATGLGSQLAEELANEFPQVEPVVFTNEVKEKMAVSVKRLFEQGKLTIPDDKDLIGDIHSIRRVVTPSGNIRFDAERNETGHADRFWALGLSVNAGTDFAEPSVRFL